MKLYDETYKLLINDLDNHLNAFRDDMEHEKGLPEKLNLFKDLLLDDYPAELQRIISYAYVTRYDIIREYHSIKWQIKALSKIKDDSIKYKAALAYVIVWTDVFVQRANAPADLLDDLKKESELLKGLAEIEDLLQRLQCPKK